jgi:hypothetical protein
MHYTQDTRSDYNAHTHNPQVKYSNSKLQQGSKFNAGSASTILHRNIFISLSLKISVRTVYSVHSHTDIRE